MKKFCTEYDEQIGTEYEYETWADGQTHIYSFDIETREEAKALETLRKKYSIEISHELRFVDHDGTHFQFFVEECINGDVQEYLLYVVIDNGIEFDWNYLPEAWEAIEEKAKKIVLKMINDGEK